MRCVTVVLVITMLLQRPSLATTLLQVVALSGDITAPEATGMIAAALQSQFGRCDVLVNNAGEGDM